MGMYLPGLVKISHKQGCFERSLFGVACIPQRIEATGPRCNPALVGKANDSQRSDNAHANDRGVEKCLELLGRHMRSYELSKRDDLE